MISQLLLTLVICGVFAAAYIGVFAVVRYMSCYTVGVVDLVLVFSVATLLGTIGGPASYVALVVTLSGGILYRAKMLLS